MCQVIAGSPDGMNKPDDFGIHRAYSFAEKLYKETIFSEAASKHDVKSNLCMFGISKHRINADTTEIIDFHGDVAGKVCVIIDDIISGGSTTLHAAEKLKERGAASVIAIATHAVLTDGALKKLLESDVLDKVMLTDTIPGAVEKLDNVDFEDKSKLVIETIAPLVNEQLALKIRPNDAKSAPSALQRLAQLARHSTPQPG
jgi:phosphoribosylpyrophosphate synthetase